MTTRSEDLYLERTADLVAKVRAMREAADREMDRFTCEADYDVRYVVGQGPKPAPVSSETISPSPASERMKQSAANAASAQTSIDFGHAPAERGDHEES